MKILIAGMAFLLAAASASAEVKKGQKYDSYNIYLKTEKAVKVQVTTVHETRDSCNHFGLTGSFRPVKNSGDSITNNQDFLADFNIISTQKGCPPMDGTRKIPLESQALVIQPINGYLSATILVPESFTLVLK